MGRLSNHASSIVWCVWCGLLVGMPYVFSFPEPSGAVSFAGAYGFAALDMLTGLLVGCSPCMEGPQVEHRKAWQACIVAGTALTVALGALELMRLLWLGEVLDCRMSWGG